MIDGKRKGLEFRPRFQHSRPPVFAARQSVALAALPAVLAHRRGRSRWRSGSTRRRSTLRWVRGFTLIELLAVLAIIMLLVALLLPSLKGARDSARTAQCASNLRQVAQGCMLYAGDSDSVFPAYWATPGNTLWQFLIGTRYLNESTDFSVYGSRAVILRSTMHCPADTSDTPFWIPPEPIRCVAINGTMCPEMGYPGFGGRVWPDAMGATMRRLSRIRYPAELSLIGDGMSGWVTTEWGGGARFFCGSPASFDYMTRHKGGMNAAFVDGHAEWKSSAWMKNEFPGWWSTSRFFDWSCIY